jgi:hypothetical protein
MYKLKTKETNISVIKFIILAKKTPSSRNVKGVGGR